MGYRSEVAYAVKFKDKEHRIRFVAVQALNPHLDLTEFNLLDEENIIIFHVEGFNHPTILVKALDESNARELVRYLKPNENIGDIKIVNF